MSGNGSGKELSIERVLSAPVGLVNGRLVPEGLEGVQRLARVVIAAKMLPRGIESEPQAIIMLAAGFEAGLSLGQTLKGVMVVNNRPSIWGDVALALCRRSPLCKGIKEWAEGEGDARVAHCQCVRDGDPDPIVRSFSVAQAKRAGLWGKSGPWKDYPERQLQHRARGFALRDAFPDLLCGLSIAEEELDIEATKTEQRRAGAEGRIHAIEEPVVDADTAHGGSGQTSEEFANEMAAQLDGQRVAGLLDNLPGPENGT